MKILAFSDLHCDRAALDALLAAAGQADLVIGAGDFAQLHRGLEETMAALEPVAHKAIYVPGNNETLDALRAATSATVLHGQTVDREGLRIAGIGCAIPPLPAPSWPSFDLPEAEAARMLEGLKGDILVTHSPPLGTVDRHATLGAIGSRAVHDWIAAQQPGLVFCGHIHDCWGRRGRIGLSEVHNLGPSVNWFET